MGGYPPGPPAPVFQGEPTPVGPSVLGNPGMMPGPMMGPVGGGMPSPMGGMPGPMGGMPGPMGGMPGPMGGMPGPMGGAAPAGMYGPMAGPPNGPVPPVPPSPNGGPPSDATGGNGQQPNGAPPPLGTSFFSAFDDRFENCDRDYTIPCSVSVDFLILKPLYSKKDVAFTSPTGVPGVAAPGTTDFGDYGYALAPRITLQWMPFDEFGIRGSWYKTSYSQSISFVNPSAANQVSSVVTPLGKSVTSPQPFFYLNALPAESVPFPFTSSYDLGSADTLVFQNSLSIQVADLDFVRTFDAPYAAGWFGLGARYADISHSYAAYRNNPGFAPGLNAFTIPNGYDPFDDDADATYQDLHDYKQIYYSTVFTGVGPSISFHMECPKETCFQFYIDTKAAAILGTRKETLYVNSRQTATFAETDELPLPFTEFDNNLVSHHSSTLFACVPVAEVEAGISIRTGNGGLRPVVKVAGIAQYWWDAGNSTDPTANLFMYGVDASVGFQF
jgi:hypothetical protein